MPIIITDSEYRKRNFLVVVDRVVLSDLPIVSVKTLSPNNRQNTTNKSESVLTRNAGEGKRQLIVQIKSCPYPILYYCFKLTGFSVFDLLIFYLMILFNFVLKHE